MDHLDRQEGSATHEHDHEGEAEHSPDDIESELVNPTSQRRVRTQTEKGKGFARRGILSAVSAVYDPLGFASPFVLSAKILLQELCSKGAEWDESISDADERKWKRWLGDLPKLENIKLQRCYRPNEFTTVKSCQLHYFSDASDSGYGVACYIRLVDDKARISSSLLMAKSRVSPLKKVTIPRMELTAATLSVRLNQVILRELDYKIDETFYWTDSMSVLHYIANETSRFQTFVANRLTVFHDSSSVNQWHYIDTEVNPADAASRGQAMDKFIENKNWLIGPDFLRLPREEWPMQNIDSRDVCHTTEIKATVAESTECPTVMDRLLTKFSSWKKLKRIVAWILKARKNLLCLVAQRKELERKSSELETDPTKRKALLDKEIEKFRLTRVVHNPVDLKITTLSVDLLQEAETAIVRYVQGHHFSDEIVSLSGHGSGVKIRKSSSLYKLDPFIQDGLLRVGGRLTRAEIPYHARHPTVLPKSSPLSQLILNATHKSTGHLGKNSILAKVRETFWILGAASIIKGIVSRCVVCRKYQARRSHQKMADLPCDRIGAKGPPFSQVGLDFFGPFEIKRGRSTVKRYGVIFTCLAIRAVHLEIAHSLDTDTCINAIRRFVARRGPPTLIRSDNGTNLVASERSLREEINKLDQNMIRNALSEKHTQWEFNPPSASHFGGVWERLIRSVRKVLNSVLHEQPVKLDDEALNTLMCEVEAILNGRPISEMPNAPDDLEALTPNHLLMLRKGEDLPPGLFCKEDNYARRRWRQVQFLADSFWQKWIKQYLPLLQERQKWQRPIKNIAVGDIVLIVDNAPRNAWCLGKVLNTHTDKRAFVRSVDLRTKSGNLTRPIHKLCLVLESDGL